MKFLTKINRRYFWTLNILLLLISVIGYFLLKNILIGEIKEDILERELAIINEIKTQNNAPNIYPIIETKKISNSKIEPKTYKKIFIYNESEDEYELYLEYTNSIKINNQYYLIKLRHSLLETDELILAIALPLLLLLILSFVTSYFITKKLTKTVWKDFEINLKKIENYSFKKLNDLDLNQSDIEEFERLNNIVNQLTEKLTTDYLSLKEFAENASHEIQTPISIVLLNLEEILQQELSEEVFKKVVLSIKALKRLSTLNQSLILLTKIDNKQFNANKVISFQEVINRKLSEFETLFESKNLKFDFIVKQDFEMKINEQLSDLLINNLLSNAINHNFQGGEIHIEIDKQELKICNSGENNSLTNENIFNRFTKGNSKSYGLGLAIVMNICETHNLEIHYEKNDLHRFTISKKL